MTKDELIQYIQNMDQKQAIKYGSIGFALLLVLFIMFSCGPRKGTMMYGICRSFLELQVAYPETINHRLVEQYPKAVRIYYTQRDPYGGYTQQMIECAYKQDPQRGWILGAVEVNRREMDIPIIQKFNQTLPAVVSAEPDLVLPSPIPLDITSYNH